MADVDTILRLTWYWLPLLLSLCNAAFGLVVWIVGRTLVSRDAHEALTIRVTRIEMHLESSPDWRSINQLREQIGELAIDVRGLTESLAGQRNEQRVMRGQVETIYQHLMETQ